MFSCCVELTLTHSVWMNQYLCLRESATEDKCKKKKKEKKAKGGDVLLYPEEWGDSRLLKNWWVQRGHVSPKTFPAVIHVLHDDFLTSISLQPAEVSWQRYLISICTTLHCASTVCMDRRKKNMCLWEGHAGFYKDRNIVHYSFWNGFSLAAHLFI